MAIAGYWTALALANLLPAGDSVLPVRSVAADVSDCGKHTVRLGVQFRQLRSIFIDH